MSLLRVTAHDNRPVGLRPSDILMVRTTHPKDRAVLVGGDASFDPKTEVRVLISGRPQRIFLRNPPRRLAQKLLSLGAVPAWWEVQLAGGGVGFCRPSAVTLIEAVGDAEKSAEGWDGAQSAAIVSIAADTLAWRLETEFEAAFLRHEKALAKEQGRGASSEEEDEVGGLDDDEDDFVETEPAPTPDASRSRKNKRAPQ